MSATAVARRLEQVRALYKLMISLRQIRVDQARPMVTSAEREPAGSSPAHARYDARVKP